MMSMYNGMVWVDEGLHEILDQTLSPNSPEGRSPGTSITSQVSLSLCLTRAAAYISFAKIMVNGR